jgi:hypothetical protein
MGRSRLEAVGESVRSGLEDAQGRAADIAEVIADRVGEAIETAGVEGRRMGKVVGKELARRWKTVDRASRENPYYLALGALAVGVAIGYLMTRDRSARRATDEEGESTESQGAESFSAL